MLSIKEIQNKKKNGEKVSVITAYDFAFAKMAEAAHIDQILVGDSLANVMLGYSSTREIGMNEMIIFTRAVSKGAPNTHIISDMPYLSDSNPTLALENAKHLLDAGAHSVKLEGAKEDVIEILLKNNSPVMGHLGLLPQTAKSFKQFGKSSEEADQLLKDAMTIDKLGVYSMVLEHIPESLGSLISQRVSAVTLGIGAGESTDGQVLVLHDVLGLNGGKSPPFAKKFANIFEIGVQGISDYIQSMAKK